MLLIIVAVIQIEALLKITKKKAAKVESNKNGQWANTNLNNLFNDDSFIRTTYKSFLNEECLLPKTDFLKPQTLIFYKNPLLLPVHVNIWYYSKKFQLK